MRASPCGIHAQTAAREPRAQRTRAHLRGGRGGEEEMHVNIHAYTHATIYGCRPPAWRDEEEEEEEGMDTCIHGFPPAWRDDDEEEEDGSASSATASQGAANGGEVGGSGGVDCGAGGGAGGGRRAGGVGGVGGGEEVEKG